MSVRARRRGREEAFRLLFQYDQGHLDLDLEASLTHLPPEAWQFARELVEGVLAHRAELDGWLERLSEGWTVARMAGTDRAVLRLAAYEVLHRPDTPVSVGINEAVELAKRYGTEQSPRFVNGILGALARAVADQGERTGESGEPE